MADSATADRDKRAKDAVQSGEGHPQKLWLRMVGVSVIIFVVMMFGIRLFVGFDVLPLKENGLWLFAMSAIAGITSLLVFDANPIFKPGTAKIIDR